ncbi:DUF998 domain-containing protein [Streptomyces sp. NPDC056796]|uniref:DUF998 domain-containing protein n=1 Tax=Streptomyces sp. NPDC056796 TaxID=3345947 RepID=UPI0036B380D0
MRSVSWWVLISSVSAPVLLVGGWTVAAKLQGPGYNPVTTTISILAADGAAGYWVMTSALVALGACHVITASGLRPAAPYGRAALAGGGLSAMLLALFPAPSSGGSFPHGVIVTVGFSLLALWPVLAVRRGIMRPRPAPARAKDTPPGPVVPGSDPVAPGSGPVVPGSDPAKPGSGPVVPGPGRSAPWGLRRTPSVTAAALIWLGGAWFLLALYLFDIAGAAERVITFAQTFWPLVVAVSCFRHVDEDRQPV